MKLIVHAPTYMCGRAADLAAKAVHDGELTDNSLIGIVSGEHCFTIKRNKSSISVWHFLKPDGQPDPDKWEPA